MTMQRPVLHVAALPFPTWQGTQALLLQMLTALAERGTGHELLTYAYSGYSASLPFTLHRARELWPYRSLRSGPSAGKVLADASLFGALEKLRRARAHSVLVAHHVEAAALSRAPLPRVFFAHTDLAAELPAYASRTHACWLERTGATLDRWLVARSHAVASFCPALVARLRALAGPAADKVRYVPAPWRLQAGIDPHERVHARARFGLTPSAHVLLYAGNLDPYQGWEAVLAALAVLAADGFEVAQLVGTESDPAPLLAAAQGAGLGALVRVAKLAGEAQRRALHAAADLAVVPRRAAGGLPVKLLDALARGLPCVLTPTAAGGLPLDDAAELCPGDDGAALAVGVARLLGKPERAAALGAAGRGYLAAHHRPALFCEALESVCTEARRRALVAPESSRQTQVS